MTTDKAAPCTFHIGSQADPKHCRWCGIELIDPATLRVTGGEYINFRTGQRIAAPTPAAPDEKMPEEQKELNMVLLEIGHQVGALEGQHILEAVFKYVERCDRLQRERDLMVAAVMDAHYIQWSANDSHRRKIDWLKQHAEAIALSDKLMRKPNV